MSNTPQSTTPDYFKIINAVLTLILTATIGCATITLSNKQYDLEQQRAHYELYARREEIFYAIQDFTRYAYSFEEPLDVKQVEEPRSYLKDFKRQTAVVYYLFNRDVVELRTNIHFDALSMVSYSSDLAFLASSTELTKEMRENQRVELRRALNNLREKMLGYHDESYKIFHNYLSLSDPNI